MRLFLCGGGDGEQTIDAINKLNEIIEHNKPILYVPLALDENIHPYDGCLEWVKGELSSVAVPGIEMVRTFEELSNKNYDNYSAIFIGGGNTYKLLKGLKESGAFKKIQEYIINDGIIFGGSAGSVIFGKDINVISCMDSNDVALSDTTGLNAINGVSIFPHYTNKKSKLTDEQNEELHMKFTKSIVDFSETVGPVIAYPEEDTLVINGDKVEMIGSKDYYYIDNGNIIKHDVLEQEYIQKLKSR